MSLLLLSPAREWVGIIYRRSKRVSLRFRRCHKLSWCCRRYRYLPFCRLVNGMDGEKKKNISNSRIPGAAYQWRRPRHIPVPETGGFFLSVVVGEAVFGYGNHYTIRLPDTRVTARRRAQPGPLKIFIYLFAREINKFLLRKSIKADCIVANTIRVSTNRIDIIIRLDRAVFFFR